ncbi:MAG: hypothetical protein FJ029_15610, partial [Actinobacteria bacterium]|nr:hypothetical protein [Actinomycetota bacterium]
MTATAVARRLRGRILAIDWRRGTARLYAERGPVRLLFPARLAARLQSLARAEVEIAGPADLEPDGRIVRLSAETVRPYPDSAAFWQPQNLAELAREQGVGPFRWPVGPSLFVDDEDFVAIQAAI